MATRDYWAEAPMNRHQTVLFDPTLDSTIREDDPVRLLDEVLAGLDWSGREAHYRTPSYFIQVFRAEHNMTSTKYRRQLRESVKTN